MNSFDSKVSICADLVTQSQKIVILSGAGLSTSSGIPDFRGPDGIYRKKYKTNPEKIFDIDFFHKKPEFFYRFHREFLLSLKTISPSYSHTFLSSLEETGKVSGLITQNIDALHQKAGSEKVYEIHGGIWKNHCIDCGKSFDYNWGFKKTMEEDVPKCDNCGGIVKPDIVFFGENVKHLEECQNLSHNADLFFVLGSSLVVTPAAFLPAMSRGKIIVINKGEVSSSYLPPNRIDVRIDGDLDLFFKKLNEKLSLTV